jgi:uncharacterized membrane protein
MTVESTRMHTILAAFGNLGPRQKTALATALALVALIVVLTLGSEPELAFIPTSLLMLLVLFQLAITQRRLLASKRSLDKLHSYHRRLRRMEQENKRSHIKDYQHELQRLEFLQQRILAAVETERLEIAESLGELKAKLD